MNEQGKFIKKVADCLAVILIIMIIGGVLGATGVLTNVIPTDSYSSPSEETAFYADNADELDVEVACADISFVTADSLYIEADTDCFRIKTKGEKISVEEKETFLNLNKSRKVTVYIPEDFVFEKVSLEMGASTLDAESLKTNRLELDTGAGDLDRHTGETGAAAHIDEGLALEVGAFEHRQAVQQVELRHGLGLGDGGQVHDLVLLDELAAEAAEGLIRTGGDGHAQPGKSRAQGGKHGIHHSPPSPASAEASVSAGAL